MSSGSHYHRLAMLVAVVAIVTSACGSSTSTPASTGPQPATIQVWLGGVLTTSTAGTPYRTWVDDVITRFKAANPGSDV